MNVAAWREKRRSAGTAGVTPRRAAQGFTIIEMLIVMVIVALISGILVTAFERVLDVRTRLVVFLDGTDTPNLIAGWFRGSVEGLMADLKDGADRFSGAPRRMIGLSVAPIGGPPGVPTRITWEIAYDPATDRTYLRYQSANHAQLTIASWPKDRGGFQYCDPDLSCYRSWPPPADPGTRPASELPALVLLDAVRGTETWPILAAPQSAPDPLPRPGSLKPVPPS